MKKLIANQGMQRVSGGFTLIEFIIIAAAIVITLTLAIPTWSNYSIRSIISDALYLVAEVKSAAAVYCLQNPAAATLTNGLVDYKFKASKYVKNLQLRGSCDAPIIVMTTKATGAKPSPVLTITGDFAAEADAFEWTCVSSGKKIHVPETCRS